MALHKDAVEHVSSGRRPKLPVAVLGHCPKHWKQFLLNAFEPLLGGVALPTAKSGLKLDKECVFRLGTESNGALCVSSSEERIRICKCGESTENEQTQHQCCAWASNGQTRVHVCFCLLSYNKEEDTSHKVMG